MSNPKCIAFNYIKTKDSYVVCKNDAIEPLENPTYCEIHWQNLINNTQNTLLKFAGRKDPVPGCFDGYVEYPCDSPRSPRSPRTPYNARYFSPKSPNPMMSSPPSPRSRGVVYNVAPVSPPVASYGTPTVVYGKPINPHTEKPVTQVTSSCGDSTCVTTGREENVKIKEKNKATRESYDDDYKDKKKFQRLIRSAPDFKWNSEYPNIYIGSDEFADYLHTIDTTKDVKEALDNIKSVKDYIDRKNPDYNFAVSEEVVDYVATKFSRYMFNPDRIEMLLSFLFAYESRDLSQKFSYYGFKFNDNTKKVNTGAVALLNTSLKGMQTESNTLLKSLAPREDPEAIIEKNKRIAEAYKPAPKQSTGGGAGGSGDRKADLLMRIDDAIKMLDDLVCSDETKKYTDAAKGILKRNRSDIQNANNQKLDAIEITIKGVETALNETPDAGPYCKGKPSGGSPIPQAPRTGGANPAVSGAVGAGGTSDDLYGQDKTITDWITFINNKLSSLDATGKEKANNLLQILNGVDNKSKRIKFNNNLDASRFLAKNLDNGSKITTAINTINASTTDPIGFDNILPPLKNTKK